jgi:hypothetical protein
MKIYLEARNLAEEGFLSLRNIIKNADLDKQDFLFGANNSITGEITDPLPLIEDLGDTVPFLNFLGMTDIAEREIQFIKKRFNKNFSFINKRNKRLGNAFLYGYDYTDLILGLNEWLEISNDPEIKILAISLINEWKKRFIIFNSTRGVSIRYFNIALPFSSLNDINMFPELLLSYQIYSNHSQNIGIAINTVNQWINLNEFKKNKLFPTFSYELSFGKYLGPYFKKILKHLKPNSIKYKLFKENTNLIFSLLKVYEETRGIEYLNAFDLWIDGINEKLKDTSSGGYKECWDELENIYPITAANFQIIEIMIQAYILTKNKKYLNIAKNLADFWINNLSPIGLVPEIINNDDWFSIADSQTDFSVALIKLSEIANDEQYLSAAMKIANGVLDYHYKKYGMANEVNWKTGKLCEEISKTKFLTLSSKIWIALNNSGSIFRNKALSKLLGDR